MQGTPKLLVIDSVNTGIAQVIVRPPLGVKWRMLHLIGYHNEGVARACGWHWNETTPGQALGTNICDWELPVGVSLGQYDVLKPMATGKNSATDNGFWRDFLLTNGFYLIFGNVSPTVGVITSVRGLYLAGRDEN